MSIINRFCWLALILVIMAYRWPNVSYAADATAELLVGQIQVWEDPLATATLEQVMEPRAQFVNLQTTSPNFGFTDSAYWIRIPITSQQREAATFYLDIRNSRLDNVTLYVVNVDGSSTMSQTGLQVPIEQWPYRATTFVMPFALAASQSVALYVRIHSKGNLLLPFALMNETELQSAVGLGWAIGVAVLATVGALLIYNLFIFSLLKSRIYLYYILLLLFSLNGIISLSGLGPFVLDHNYMWLLRDGILWTAACSLVCMIAFMREFLEIQQHRWLNRVALVFMLWGVLLSVGIFLWPVQISYLMVLGITLIFPLFCFVAGMHVWQQGKREVRFIIFGQISSWFGLIAISLISLDLLDYQPLLYLAPLIGGAIDALVLSLALADRIRLLQLAQIAAEESARLNLEIRSDELERLVVERTAEIKTLQGILPICANCKKIRDDDGAWQQMEAYISQRSDAKFSHGICTDCMRELYPEIYHKRTQTSPG